MNRQNSNEPQTDLNRILEIISKIGKKSENGDYIYRGEPECYPKVSSTLYRILEESKVEHPERIVEKVQEAELAEAKNYIHEADQFEILTQLQHFGGKTNLIDFTTDYYTALFFACNGYPDKKGRIILQDKNGAIKDWIKEPQNSDPGSRPYVQKSIFVRPPEGFIESHEDDIVKIPKDLKRPLLKHLEKEFGISTDSIYHDIHGFIRSQNLRWGANTAYNLGVIYQNRRDETDNPQERTQYNQKAIEHLTNAIRLNLDYTESYKNRGVAYDFGGDYNHAIEDYNTMIKSNPNDAAAYNDRGNTYSNKGDYPHAIEDYTQAIKLNRRLAEAYNNRGTAYVQNGAIEPAIKDFDKAIELKNDYAIAYIGRGVAKHDLERIREAKQDLQTALTLVEQAGDEPLKTKIEAAIRDLD